MRRRRPQLLRASCLRAWRCAAGKAVLSAVGLSAVPRGFLGRRRRRRRARAFIKARATAVPDRKSAIQWPLRMGAPGVGPGALLRGRSTVQRAGCHCHPKAVGVCGSISAPVPCTRSYHTRRSMASTRGSSSSTDTPAWCRQLGPMALSASLAPATRTRKKKLRRLRPRPRPRLRPKLSLRLRLRPRWSPRLRRWNPRQGLKRRPRRKPRFGRKQMPRL
mmetsp:Transcript_129319/g.289146  ORF Transcript_129319/g.289146 Transcript_129319/m.289146 type:complete len:219 (-) Transcript_129319:1075-1731(-)